MTKYLAYINNKFVNNSSYVEVYSPETHEVIGTFPSLTVNQIDEAFNAAQKAFLLWSKLDYKKRCQFLLDFGSKLKENVNDITDLLVKEIAKPYNDAKTEVLRSIDYIIETVHVYSELMENPTTLLSSNEITIPEGKVGIFKLKPLGVALTISPFNYPVNLMIAKIVPALITGNTVVHKSATQGSLVGGLIAKIFSQITVNDQKILAGVFNYVTGRGREIGDYLIAHKAISVASFTGGTDIGIKLAKNMIMHPYVLELGGKDAALVLDDANNEQTANEIVKGAYNFSGQRCTAIKRVFITSKKAKEIIPLLVSKVNKLTIGKAADNAYITALVEKKSIDVAQELYKDAIEKGAVNLIGEFKTENNLLYPILLDQVTPKMKIAWVEPFSPILPILYYEDLNNAIDLINQSEYGLQCSIFTTDYQKVDQIASKIDVGTVNINRASSRGPDILPFSGVKNSGFGTQGITDALKSFTRLQGLILNDQN